LAADPQLDAWRGASKWAASGALAASSVTRADYDEQGSAYLVEHELSNRYTVPVADGLSNSIHSRAK